MATKRSALSEALYTLNKRPRGPHPEDCEPCGICAWCQRRHEAARLLRRALKERNQMLLLLARASHYVPAGLELEIKLLLNNTDAAYLIEATKEKG